jgi:hypothetical protein
VIEQQADVAGALVRFDDGFELDGWIVERHNRWIEGYVKARRRRCRLGGT